MSNKSTNALKSQNTALGAVVVIIVVVCAGIVYLLQSPSVPISKSSKVELPGDRINPQEIWMSKIENDSKMTDQKLKYLETLILEAKKKETEKEDENQKLRQEISKLKHDLKSVSEVAKAHREFRKETAQIPPEINVPSYKSHFTSEHDPFVISGKRDGVPGRNIRPLLKEVVMGSGKKAVFHIDRAIPAGTTVKALLVSSVDAPCGVYSGSDPHPIKLRILDDGHLPKEVMVKLKGGIIVGSAYGDISTERVYMRLERLTKVEENGEFIETSVTGFVTGEDGKFGVRGSMVDKSGKLVTYAAYSGFFSSIGQFLNTAAMAYQSEHCSDAVAINLSSSGMQGTSGAFDTLADYYIQRAEQIMPVIQVTAGRIVDITFTHKADLGDLYTKEKVKEVRESSRRINNG